MVIAVAIVHCSSNAYTEQPNHFALLPGGIDAPGINHDLGPCSDLFYVKPTTPTDEMSGIWSMGKGQTICLDRDA